MALEDNPNLRFNRHFSAKAILAIEERSALLMAIYGIDFYN